MTRPGLFLGLAVVLSLAACSRSDSAKETKTADETDAAPPPAHVTEDHPAAYTSKTRPLLDSGDVPLLEQLDRENTRVVTAALPSIVRISAMVPVDPHAQTYDFPFHFPGLPHGVRTLVPSYGSGVIISRDGYIVTNNHVIDEAHSIEVQIKDDPRNYPVRVVAADAPSDLAVLKVEATGLHAMPWGDSDKVQVGEQVFAIGNPFNLDTSVSKGIVSGKGRNLPESSNYEDYIQTDAAVNVGNSGGALVNIHGELVGINAAIASFTRGNEGVAFAIPSNLARNTVEQLLKRGSIVRGYLGVRLPTKIDEGVPEQLGLDRRGALLAGIQPSSPADEAKLRPVDFITEVDGHKIESVPQFRLVVAEIPVGKEVVVNFIRGGTAKTARVKIAELPKESDLRDSLPPPDAGSDANPGTAAVPEADDVLAGVQVVDLNQKSREKFGVDDFVTSGVVVTGVPSGSPAESKGLERGDVIEVACAQRGSIKTLANAGDFSGVVKTLKADQNVVLLVHHGKLSGQEDRSSSFVYLTPAAK